jgi:hypothetical protein
MKRMLSIALLGMSFSVFAAEDRQLQLPQPGAPLQGPGQQALPKGHWGDALVVSGLKAASTSFFCSVPVAGLALFVGKERGDFAIPLAVAVGSYGAKSFLWGLTRELSPEGEAIRNQRVAMINGAALLVGGALILKRYS